MNKKILPGFAALPAQAIIFHTCLYRPETGFPVDYIDRNGHIKREIFNFSARRADQVEMAARISFITVVHAFELQFLDKFVIFEQAEDVVYGGQTDRVDLLASFAIDIESTRMALVMDQFRYDNQALRGYFQSCLPQARNDRIF